MNERLEQHYDRKYRHESGAVEIPDIPLVRVPRNRFEAAVKFFPRAFSGGAVLELGAGNGNVAKALLAREPRIQQYVLSDSSDLRLDNVKRLLNDPRVTTRRLDAESIPEDLNGQFDAIIMIALIEHLVDPLGAMQRIARLLRPGGFVYIDTPNIAKYTQRLKLLVGRFPSTAAYNEGLTTFRHTPADLYDEGHLHYFTFRSLSLMLTTRCGFARVVKFGYPGGRAVLGRHVHGLLARWWPALFSDLVIAAYV